MIVSNEHRDVNPPAHLISDGSLTSGSPNTGEEEAGVSTDNAATSLTSRDHGTRNRPSAANAPSCTTFGEVVAGGKRELDPLAGAFRLALQSACLSAFGIVGVDVWLRDERDGSFRPAPGGYYRHVSHQPPGDWERHGLTRLEDAAATAPPQLPGAGLAGYLWSRCRAADRACVWRDLAALLTDPDQPPCDRTRALARAGYGQAAGVPFDVRGYCGVVLFLARGSARPLQLAEAANDAHLRVAADLIGALSAHAAAAAASRTAKSDRLARTLRRVRAKLMAIAVFLQLFNEPRLVAVADRRNTVPAVGGAKRSQVGRAWSELQRKMSRTYRQSAIQAAASEMRRKMSDTYRRSALQACSKVLRRKARMTIEKSKGGSLHPPPSMQLAQSAWVFVGAFVTLLALSGLSSALEGSTGYSILLGPFGALMTLQYGLTQAPASQPRNIIYGQVVSLSIALTINLFVPTETWVRVPLATAFAIATMCKLGITHPPAGAAAAIFASSDQNTTIQFVYFGLTLLGNIIAIFTAVLINNLNDKRHYPIYYAFVQGSFKNRLEKALRSLVVYPKRRSQNTRDTRL